METDDGGPPAAVYGVPDLLRMAADRVAKNDPEVRVILDTVSPGELYLGVLMPMPP